ncbi:hypothetical protein BC834DRAFT_133702 [Gloeopeniophorella convolvens]|nr:hypothetical protein BC834DRAFT_133702 [Gloeopeniophorella convolvens]
MSSYGLMSERPTLPPLRSLALPMPGGSHKTNLPGIHELCNYDNDMVCSRHPAWMTASNSVSLQNRTPASHDWQRNRQGSGSPSSPSSDAPPPSITSALASPPPTTTSFASLQRASPIETHVRLVLTDSFDSADAALVLCSVGAPRASSTPRMISSPDALDGIKPGAPLLVVGRALERIRRPGTALGKGVRMHPYRLIHTSTTSHASSTMTSNRHTPRK